MVDQSLVNDLQHIADLLDGKIKPKRVIAKVEQPTYPVKVPKPKPVPKPVFVAPEPKRVVTMKAPPPAPKPVPMPTITARSTKSTSPEEQALLDEYKTYVEEINAIILKQQGVRDKPDKLDDLIKEEAELQTKCDSCLFRLEKLRGI